MRERVSIGWAMAIAAASLLVTACGEDGEVASDEELPRTAPSALTRVTSEGFTAPGDGVASPDGTRFYFTAFTLDLEPRAGIFSVASEGGPVELLFAGDPLEYPTGLLMSCDGTTVYVADMSLGDELDSSGAAGGAIYELTVGSNALSPLTADGIAVPSGLAMGSDCETLHVTGYNAMGQPAVFTVPVAGGTATETFSGEPLVSPTGVHVDENDVAWVMDQLASGDDGPGVLYAIGPDGSISPVLSGLRMGAPGGVSLAAGGTTAVIPQLDENGNAQLLSVNTDSGEQTVLPAPEIEGPAGIRTAREAGIFVVVDNEGDAIFRAR